MTGGNSDFDNMSLGQVRNIAQRQTTDYETAKRAQEWLDRYEAAKDEQREKVARSAKNAAWIAAIFAAVSTVITICLALARK